VRNFGVVVVCVVHVCARVLMQFERQKDVVLKLESLLMTEREQREKDKKVDMEREIVRQQGLEQERQVTPMCEQKRIKTHTKNTKTHAYTQMHLQRTHSGGQPHRRSASSLHSHQRHPVSQRKWTRWRTRQR
jgi:hypothetical protein